MSAPILPMRETMRRIVLRFIEAEAHDPGEFRARLDIALRDGWLTEDEARAFKLARGSWRHNEHAT
jgi:hypothetical protein